jgi:hypothetical protein
MEDRTNSAFILIRWSTGVTRSVTSLSSLQSTLFIAKKLRSCSCIHAFQDDASTGAIWPKQNHSKSVDSLWFPPVSVIILHFYSPWTNTTTWPSHSHLLHEGCVSNTATSVFVTKIQLSILAATYKVNNSFQIYFKVLMLVKINLWSSMVITHTDLLSCHNGYNTYWLPVVS